MCNSLLEKQENADDVILLCFLSLLEELSAPELKKLQRKERKAQHKAAQAKAQEEKKGETFLLQSQEILIKNKWHDGRLEVHTYIHN